MVDQKKGGKSILTDDTSTPTKTGKPASATKGQLDSVAASLRRAYDDTLNESVPDTMMDLLKRLG